MHHSQLNIDSYISYFILFYYYYFFDPQIPDPITLY
jgi:hypothetical protein